MDEFKRLYQSDNGRLSIRDSKGRTAAHQAAARNRVNILRYINDQRAGRLIFYIHIFKYFDINSVNSIFYIF